MPAILLHGVFSAVVAAAPVVPEIAWQAPPGCPVEADVRDRVARLLAGTTGGMDGVAVELRVEALVDGRFRLRALLLGPSDAGERTLEAGSCGELAEAAALLTALAVQPALAGAVPPPPESHADPVVPPASVLTEPPSAAESSASPQPSPGPPPSRNRWGLLTLAGGVAVGVLTTPMAVLQAAGGVRGKKWSVVLTQTFWLPRTMPSADDPEVGGRMWLWAAGIRGCGVPWSARIEVNVCGAVEAGVVTGRGTGDLEIQRRQTSPWLAVSAGPGAAVRLGERVRLTLGVDLLVVPFRPNFTIVGRGEVCCATQVGGRVLLGVLLRLP